MARRMAGDIASESEENYKKPSDLLTGSECITPRSGSRNVDQQGWLYTVHKCFKYIEIYLIQYIKIEYLNRKSKNYTIRSLALGES